MDDISDFEGETPHTGKFECVQCAKKYMSKKSLIRHVRDSHKENGYAEGTSCRKTYPYQCEICHNNFSKHFHLRAHMRNRHSVQNFKPTSHECFFCSMKLDKKTLLTHLEEEHQCNLKCDTFTFKSLAEFYEWKDEVQKSTKSVFKIERGCRAIGSKKHYFYICHRSGVFKPEGSGLRHLKTRGSSKTGYFCPASIKVVESAEGECSIQYINCHIGHTNDLCEESDFLHQELRKLSESTVPSEPSPSLSQRLEKMKQHFEKICDSVTTEEQYNVLQRLVASIQPTLSSCQSTATTLPTVQATVSYNKNIEPQKRYFSNQKTQKCKKKKLKPTLEESLQTACNLLL